MKRFIVAALIFIAQNSSAQTEPSWGLGASVGGLVGINEAVHQSLNPEFRIFGLWENGIAKHWSLEGGIGIGKLSSQSQGHYSEYSTNIIPIDLRIRFTPLINDEWQPYFYVGFGLAHFNVTSVPYNAATDAKLNNTSGFIPIGIGLRRLLMKDFAIEASIGENPSFTDDLNPVHDNRNDAFWGFAINITYTFGSKNVLTPIRINEDEFDFGSQGTSQIFGSIAFDSGTAHLRPESDPLLIPVMNALLNHPHIEIEIRAYTDNAGDFDMAMALTHDRAESIKVWLVSRGVPPSRISTQGYGPHNPIVPNNSPENMLMNHRIEIVRMK